MEKKKFQLSKALQKDDSELNHAKLCFYQKSLEY